MDFPVKSTAGFTQYLRREVQTMKSLIRAACLVSLSILFATAPALAGPSGGCASASVSITNGSNAITPGVSFLIYGLGTNCSSSKQRYVVSFSGMSDCGQKVDVASSTITFRAGQTYGFPVTYTLPYNTCTGPWTATIAISDQGTVVATGTTVISVQ